MSFIKSTLLAASLATVAIAPAFAGPHGNGHGKGHGHDNEAAYQGYEVEHYGHDGNRAGCPPGLAKKNNGCLPPGQAKKLIVGQPVPAGAIYTIPRNVLTTLPPAPAGYRYAIVNNQLVLTQNNLVVDIIRSLIG